MKLTTAICLALLFATPLFAIQAPSGKTWPAWRGPEQNGHAADAANPPVEWSETNNVKWKVELPGLGNSTPSVWGEKIILTWARPTGRTIEVSGKDPSGNPKPNEFQELFVSAYDFDSGKETWKTKVAEAVPHAVYHPTGSYAAASTVTDGERIYAFFGSLGLFALDMDGNVVWEYKLPLMNTMANFGEGASPVLKDNILVIPWDEQSKSFVVGIDATNGQEIWRTDRNTDSAWTTPVIVDDGGTNHVILSGTANTRAYDLNTGEEKWHCGGMSSNPTSSPVAEGNLVFIGNSYRGKVVQAINFAGASGDLSNSPNLVWTHRKSASYVPTPVVVDDKLYFLRDSVGILNCLDIKTGEEIFPGKRIGLKKIHASPLVAAKRIYISSLEGDTVVLDPANNCEALAKNHLDDAFDASPVAIDSSLILRGRRHLYHIK